jgi:hypothetical protein
VVSIDVESNYKIATFSISQTVDGGNEWRSVYNCKKIDYNGLQLTDSFCFSQKFWLGAVISWLD